MRTLRVLSVATLVLIGVYFVFRAIVAACTGAACDAYIPISLLIPLAILVLVAITGVMATLNARRARPWMAILVAATILGVAGPLVALAIFRDSPDLFVPTAAVLELIVPVATLAYTVGAAKA